MTASSILCLPNYPHSLFLTDLSTSILGPLQSVFLSNKGDSISVLGLYL